MEEYKLTAETREGLLSGRSHIRSAQLFGTGSGTNLAETRSPESDGSGNEVRTN